MLGSMFAHLHISTLQPQYFHMHRDFKPQPITITITITITIAIEITVLYGCACLLSGKRFHYHLVL